MERRIVSTLLHLLGILALYWGTKAFFDNPAHDPADLYNFLPATVSFLLGVVTSNLRPQTFAWVTRFDPLTVVVVFAAVVVMVLALIFLFIRDKETAKTLFEWSFTLLTFLAGLEVGKQRPKRRTTASPATGSSPRSGGQS